jgi:hypothetical protein
MKKILIVSAIFLFVTSVYAMAVQTAFTPIVRNINLNNEVTAASSAVLIPAQVSNTILYNTGQGVVDVAITLPPAAYGMYFKAFSITPRANKWGVKADATNKIYLYNADETISIGALGGYARMQNTQVGQLFECGAFHDVAGYNWWCKAITVGTSTFEAN